MGEFLVGLNVAYAGKSIPIELFIKSIIVRLRTKASDAEYLRCKMMEMTTKCAWIDHDLHEVLVLISFPCFVYFCLAFTKTMLFCSVKSSFYRILCRWLIQSSYINQKMLGVALYVSPSLVASRKSVETAVWKNPPQDSSIMSFAFGGYFAAFAEFEQDHSNSNLSSGCQRNWNVVAKNAVRWVPRFWLHLYPLSNVQMLAQIKHRKHDATTA